MGRIALLLALTTMLLSISMSLRGKREHRRFRYFEKLAAVDNLSHGSHGAYWEVGFGEGRGIPVIYTCEKSAWHKTKSHFDTNHVLTIVWDSADLKKAEDALAATIRATLRAEAKQTDD
jgi:hypothetical protein